MTLYVRGVEFAGLTPTWHRLVALADCSTWAYWRCFAGAAAHVDAMSKDVPEGRICSKCEHIEERELVVDGHERRVVQIKPDTYREVGAGTLIEVDAGRVWRLRPPSSWVSF